MMGTINCVYETPCGWCSKWDKECDKKMHTQSHRMKNPKPIKVADDISEGAVTNIMCQSEYDHEWECIGMSTEGTDYRCKKCNGYKTVPIECQPLSVTI